MKSFLSPPETAQSLVGIGKMKANLPIDKMFFLAILAGVYIGFGAHLCTTATTGVAAKAGFGFAKFLGGAVFSVGLMLVVIAGSELFTGNCLMPVALYKGEIKFNGLLKNWVVVWIGNFVGSLLLAWIIYSGGLNGVGGAASAVGENAIAIASGKAGLSFGQVFFRGIGCNWLVCLAVVLAISSQDIVSKIFSCFFPIMAFVAMGFEHSVANMYFIPAGIFAAHGTAAGLNWGTALANIGAATLGNIIGGGFFVATFYWFIYVKDSKEN